MLQKNMEIKLEYQLLSEVFNKMGDGFIVIDKDRKIRFLNQTLIDLFGNKVGSNCHELFFDFPHKCKGCILDDIYKNQKGVFSHTRCDRDKFRRWLEITYITTNVLSKSPKDKNTYIMGIVHDITARKKLMEALRVKNQELKQKNEELESFVYTVSHDLKSPVLSLQGLVGMLIEDYSDKLDGEIREYLEDIKNSAQKMGLLIQDLLDLSRVGRSRNPRSQVPAKEIIEEAVDQLKFQLKEKGVDLYIEENLPICYCDKKMVVLALVNLLDNAIKFVGENPYPLIEVGCKIQGDNKVFYVKDNGIGIEAKYHDKIFEIFQTLDEIKDPRSTGVGLAIVKRIVDVHMGRAWVESEKGKGATFFLSLPDKKPLFNEGR